MEYTKSCFICISAETDLSVARGDLKFSKELGWDKYTPAVRLDHIQENEYLED